MRVYADGLTSTVQDYPRIANLLGFSNINQAPTFSRYGLVVASAQAGTDGALQALKLLSPTTTVLFYVDSSSVPVPGFSGMDIYPGWWLTLAGTTLAAPLDATSTTVYVTDASMINQNLSSNPDVLVDGESMHVISVNTSTNTLTVRRGYSSIGAPHASGARIAAHATNWPGTWMLNVTSYCPVDPATGWAWTDYLAHEVQTIQTSAPWSGVFYDNDRASWASLSNGRLDANNDNIADGGNGPSGTGWQDGETYLFSRTRALAPSAIIVGNGIYYAGGTNGVEMEHFPYWQGGWSSAFETYLQLAGSGGLAPTSIVNSDTNDTGTQDLQSMRFNLATALMGNGYFAYDYGTNYHGQTWWYDEYDNGAGSSLASPISNSQATVPLVAGAGSKFRVGDVVYVPDEVGPGQNDDEQMLVTAVNGDTMTVQRGYNGTTAYAHLVSYKVMTQAQISAGQGWLGQPLGPATSLTPLGSTMLTNGSFDQSGSPWYSPWIFQVHSPAAGSINQDASTSVDGQSAVRVDTSQATPSTPYGVALRQLLPNLQTGATYTVTFWAKASAGQSIDALVQLAGPPSTVVASQTVALSGNWQQYRFTFTASSLASGLALQLNMGRSSGSVWLDKVSLQQGDINTWRRDFTHGTVLLNGTNAPQTVTVGAGYSHIAGTQDTTVNDGQVVTSVTINPQDAVLLDRTPSLPTPSANSTPPDQYGSTINLSGTKDSSVATILINSSSTGVTYADSTHWSYNGFPLSLGGNAISIYGTDATGDYSPTVAITVNRHKMGDIDGDGNIDLTDLSIFAMDWMHSGGGILNPLCDMNGDGTVNLTDFSIFASAYGN